jgi:hypothetical protein
LTFRSINRWALSRKFPCEPQMFRYSVTSLGTQKQHLWYFHIFVVGGWGWWAINSKYNTLYNYQPCKSVIWWIFSHRKIMSPEGGINFRGETIHHITLNLVRVWYDESSPRERLCHPRVASHQLHLPVCQKLPCQAITSTLSWQVLFKLQHWDWWFEGREYFFYDFLFCHCLLIQVFLDLFFQTLPDYLECVHSLFC